MLCLLISLAGVAQIKVRLLTSAKPTYVWFTVTSGQFFIKTSGTTHGSLQKGQTALLTLLKGKVVIKASDISAFSIDSLELVAADQSCIFRLGQGSPGRLQGNYSGSLSCKPDMGSLLLINTTDIEKYIAGVVKAEGGGGRLTEYFKTQAVIARTYTYRYLDRHVHDHYNLCDDVHCQSYLGNVTDKLINDAVTATAGDVIVTSDSILIIAAFHSNCGGETSPSEYAWMMSLPYLKKVNDPYCLNSRNARWVKTIPLGDWENALESNGYKKPADRVDSYDFNQETRQADYIKGSFRLPFRDLRNTLDLRSAWFSVLTKGDSVTLAGKGYGHGVGLCQEGAMEMARLGSPFDEIIRFYYPGVTIIKIGDVKKTAAPR
ncbi:MAG: SpoIID/LytB domain-containing protein [Bacteroidales bacterium]